MVTPFKRRHACKPHQLHHPRIGQITRDPLLLPHVQNPTLLLASIHSSAPVNALRGFWHRLTRPNLQPAPAWPADRKPLLLKISDYGIPKPCRLLHIGANGGQEASYYEAHAIQAWHVEAIPELFQTLKAHCQQFKHQTPILACISDEPGKEVVFHVASNSGLSSSLLGLGRHAVANPSITYVRSINLASATIDSLIESGVLPSEIDFLVLDVQGAELLALKGAQGLLASGSLRGALIETSVHPLYEGGSTYLDVSALLQRHGLYMCEAIFNKNGWCDVIYGRQYWPS